MKRSEMIKLMELEDIARCRYVGFNSHYERMESLLNCIENAGMLPPENRDFNLGNSWEPEDE